MLTINGRQFESLLCVPASMPPFAISFEEASERIAALPGAYVEPDGSFALATPHSPQPTPHTFGSLYDRDERLLYVEIRTKSSASTLTTIIKLLGESYGSVVVQLPELGVWLDGTSFVRLAFN